MIASTLLTVAAVLTTVAAQATKPAQPACELLVDDMRPERTYRLSEKYGGYRMTNLLGGDYGVDGASQLVNDTNAGYMTITPGNDPKQLNNDPVHPPQPLGVNYFFFKFEWDDDFTHCADLSPYKGISITISSPPGTDVGITLTQKNDACNNRTLDSQYVNMTKYITPDGTFQEMYIPWTDFAKNWDGVSDFSFAHDKDLTFVGFSPAAGEQYKIERIALKADCTANVAALAPQSMLMTATASGAAAATGTAAAATTGAATGAKTTAAPAVSSGGAVVSQTSAVPTTSKNSGSTLAGSILSALGAALGALVMF
ncbi:hypothetical protein HK101_001756 [Irineochytrium annulatum]|nr:hypothetical protein HK101_001756 [Irineochytrium annulatum]